MKRYDYDPAKLKGLEPPTGDGGMPHLSFVEALRGGVGRAGFAAGRTLCAVTSTANGNGSSMACMVEIKLHGITLPTGFTLWAGGFNSTRTGMGSHVYGCVVHAERAVPLWRRLAFHKGLSCKPTQSIGAAVDAMLLDAWGFPGELKRMRRLAVSAEDKTDFILEAARRNYISFGRISELMGRATGDDGGTAWGLAMQFHDALDRGPVIVNSKKTHRLDQMWAIRSLLMSKREVTSVDSY